MHEDTHSVQLFLHVNTMQGKIRIIFYNLKLSQQR